MIGNLIWQGQGASIPLTGISCRKSSNIKFCIDIMTCKIVECSKTKLQEKEVTCNSKIDVVTGVESMVWL